MSESIDTLIIGAGVIGLAIASKLAEKGRNTLIVEKQEAIGTGVSSRNSEVIHAGIYYPAGSLKATLCVAGKQQLYHYCQQAGVPHNNIGKLIVAVTPAEERQLEKLKNNAQRNGVEDLRYLSPNELKKYEPNVSASAALFSPSTGIVDAQQLMLALLAKAEANHAILSLCTSVTSIQKATNDFDVEVNSAGEVFRFRANNVVNAAGLDAQHVAATIADFPQQEIPPLYYCKGCYFHLSGKSPFNHLIYPVPDKSARGLGVHATLNLVGEVKFGPDVDYVDTLDFTVPDTKLKQITAAVQRYFPAVEQRHLSPHYAGIRPKLQGPDDDQTKDFVIQNEAVHGFPGLVQLFGIESPGLTSCLSIADYVKQQLDHR